LSQDELHHLLDELIEESPYGSRQYHQLKRLAFEKQLWDTRLQESREQFKRWQLDYKSLQHLLAENDFNACMQQLGHPYRILGGPIRLDQSQQKLALAELSVTLQQRQEVEPVIAKLAQALHLYFQQYFKDGHHPPEEDEQAKASLQDFGKNPEKGGSPDFLEYTQYLEHLENLLGTDELAELEPWGKSLPSYAAILHAEAYRTNLPERLREFLIDTTPWDVSQYSLLEQLFELENQVHCGRKILEKMLSLKNPLALDFIDRQLRQQHLSELIQKYLTQQDPATLNAFQMKAVEGNLDCLLSAINNLMGIDQAYFYKTIEKYELQNGVFGQIIDRLFSQTPQQQYGMDQQHLQRVLEQQENLPKNLIAVLQRTLPRGLEGKSIPAALDFMDRLNEQIGKLRQKMQGGEALNTEQKMSFSDTETVRFILFSHIHHRILTSKPLEKILSLSEQVLSQRLDTFYQFELTTGLNKNITGLLEHLWKKIPKLAPPSFANP
jgi:hypothetical protein